MLCEVTGGVINIGNEFFIRAMILKRAVEPQNAQKSHKNQVHAFLEIPRRLVITKIVTTSCFIYVTYVLSVANCRL
jgi:hypothetical protein